MRGGGAEGVTTLVGAGNDTEGPVESDCGEEGMEGGGWLDEGDGAEGLGDVAGSGEMVPD